MDNACTGARTDVMYDVQMDGMDDAWTDTITDIMYDVWTGGDFTRILCK